MDIMIFSILCAIKSIILDFLWSNWIKHWLNHVISLLEQAEADLKQSGTSYVVILVQVHMFWLISCHKPREIRVLVRRSRSKTLETIIHSTVYII